MFKSNATGAYVPSISQAVRPDVVSDVKPEDQIRLLVPSYLGFVDPRETYVRFNLKMEGVGRVIPDKNAGAHALFRNLLIRDGANSATLVSEEDYNASVGMLNPITQQSSVYNKHNLFEGVVENVNENGADPSNLYYATPPSLVGSDEDNIVGDAEQLEVKIQMPLRTKFMGGKIIPVGLLGGLRFQIDTENPLRALQYVETTGLCEDTRVDEFGIAIPAAQLTTGTGGNGFGAGDQKRNNGDSKQGAYSVKLEVGTTDNQTNNPFGVGDQLFIQKTAGADVGQGELLGSVVGFFSDGTDLGVQYVPQRAEAVGLTHAYASADAPKVFVKPSQRRIAHTGLVVKGDGAGGAGTGSGSAPAPSYTISDFEMVCLKVEPPESYVASMTKRAMSGEGVAMDYDTYTLYRHNQSNKVGLTTALIPAQQSRALSCLSQPLAVADFRDIAVSSLVGEPDSARNYQFVFGTHLIPNRVVELSRYSQQLGTGVGRTFRSDALHLSELQKAILNINEPVRNLHKIHEHFAIGRAFTRYGQVFNLKDNSLSLRVDYESTAAQDKIFNNYIFHKRRLVINKDGVSVLV
jgi:hypothetical protein